MHFLSSTLAAAGLMMSLGSLPAVAERQCRAFERIDTVMTLLIARPADQAPCVTIEKRSGTVMVVTVRAVERADRGEVNVIVSGGPINPYENEEDSLTLPSANGWARVMVLHDEVAKATISIEPLHAHGYKIQILVHEVVIASLLRNALKEAFIAIVGRELLDFAVGDSVGNNPIVPYLFKIAKIYARSETEAQFIDQLAAAIAVDASLAQTDLPRWVRTGATAFVGHGLREIGRAAATAPKWSLPSYIVDTSLSAAE